VWASPSHLAQSGVATIISIIFHLKKKWQIHGTQLNKKKMLAFGHFQDMQLQNIVMNFDMSL
jgi:hypothetical protein